MSAPVPVEVGVHSGDVYGLGDTSAEPPNLLVYYRDLGLGEDMFVVVHVMANRGRASLMFRESLLE